MKKRATSYKKRRPLWLIALVENRTFPKHNASFRADTLSGAAWVAQFPDSGSVDDLSEPFRTNVRNFMQALTIAGAKLSIASTRRPTERAYLMHWSFRIVRENYNPQTVPPMAGVDIQWWHGDLPRSLKGAREMVTGYNIAYRPSLTSRHIAGKAIDMNVKWTGTLNIKKADGQNVEIVSTPRTHMNIELHPVGASYGVKKLVSDPPHWSDTGN